MYKNCREELLAVMRAFVIETGENEFSRAEAIAAIPDFHKELEQYEIYNGLKSKAEFEEIVLSRFTSWSEDNQLFECSIFQNIIENQILYLQMNDDEIVDFYRRVKDTLKGKKYKIIYLSVDNVREAEEIIKKERSDEAGNEMWFPVMIKYLEGAPFFKAHGYIGMEAMYNNDHANGLV